MAFMTLGLALNCNICTKWTHTCYFRGPGVYGSIRVPYVITVMQGNDEKTDLEPMSGFVTFADREFMAVSSELLD